MVKPENQGTWIQLGVRNAGIRKTMKAINWAYCWAVVQESMGREPTVEEVGDWWNMSRRTAFRDQSSFRAAFPTLDSPAPLYASEEARSKIARHAAFGDRMDRWAEERRSRREVDAVDAAMQRATPPLGTE